ncbi:MAG TPA: tetratricopeptide repeat protein [Parvibaculum sp.]|uniref:tetratricopeptide repeat protein n=1 Tax=Parvibaculum sp. TaxID=2024848 RepID=UPI002C31232C|nr:tetratricopeptide repeat protein [Parvibaculum sp.]HMM15443.1 tetratricopeptide repeat protein [Parvibaculum sp.]
MKRQIRILVAASLSLLLLGACDKHTLGAMDALDSSGNAAAPLGDASSATLYLTIVEGLIDQGRYRAALGYLDQYAVAETKTPRYLRLRGEALLGVGRYDEAAVAFSDLTGTELAAAGFNGLGRVAAAKSLWPDAEKNFTQAVAARPSSADYLNNLGFAELHLGGDALPRAEFNLRQAQEIDPSSVSIRNNLVLALLMAGKDDEARQILDSIEMPRERAAVQKFAVDWVRARQKSKLE